MKFKTFSQFLFVLLLLAFASSYAQKTVRLQDTYQDTISTAQKYIILNPQRVYQLYKVTLWTTTGTDTIHIASRTAGGAFYIDAALGDLSNGQVVTAATNLAVTTTKKDYVIFDPSPLGIKIYSNDVSCSTVFIITGKNGYNVPFTSPSMTIIGGATEASLLLLLSYAHPANVNGGSGGLKSITGADTTIFTGATTAVAFSIVALDTTEWSLDGTWTKRNILLPYQSFSTIVPISPVTYPKLYLRSYGGVTARNVIFEWFGY